MYHKSGVGNYCRSLPKGQSIIKTKRGLYLHIQDGDFSLSLQPLTHWRIDEISCSPRSIEGLQTDIEAFGVERFEIVAQRVLGLPRHFRSMWADAILKAPLRDDEIVLMIREAIGEVAFSAIEQVDKWLLTSANGLYRFYLPKATTKTA